MKGIDIVFALLVAALLIGSVMYHVRRHRSGAVGCAYCKGVCRQDAKNICKTVGSAHTRSRTQSP